MEERTMASIRKALGLSVLGVMVAGVMSAPFIVEHDRARAEAPAIVEHDRTRASLPAIEHDRTAAIINHDRN
jgi:hypothetical protein